MLGQAGSTAGGDDAALRERDADRLQLTSQQVEISRLQGNISHLQEDNALLHEQLRNANNKLAVLLLLHPQVVRANVTTSWTVLIQAIRVLG